MRLAILSDIHGNLEALTACLRHAGERGAERHAFLGDYVGYGADPDGVVAIIADHVSRGAIAVKGNHDEALEDEGGYFNEAASAALALARQRLSTEQRAFLAGLPLVIDDDPMCFTHATASGPGQWEYIDNTGAARRSIEACSMTYVFAGHLHTQTLYFETAADRMSLIAPVPGAAISTRGPRRWLAIVGSVGQPRDRNPAAAYAMFDTVRLEMTFHRVAYDFRAAAAKIRASGLAESLACRVETGI